MELLQAFVFGLIGGLIGYTLTTSSLKIFGPYITLVLVLVAAASLIFSGDASAADTVTPVATLQTSLVEIIQQVSTGVKEGVSFLQQELPDVVRQLLMFNLVMKIVQVSFGILCLALPIIYWVLYATSKESCKGWPYFGSCHKAETAFVGGWVLAFVSGLIGFGFIFANTEELFKLWIAPKVWLIEYAASLVK